jgi:Protein of unknown function (DUF3379)
MTHEEFQLAAGADPTSLSEEQAQHLAQCPECARFHAEMLKLEARLGPALRIPVTARGSPIRVHPTMWPYGLAAALALAAVLVATFLTVYPKDALAHAVAMHVEAEPAEFASSAPEDPSSLARVMTDAGIELLPGGPSVSYARSCPLRGHTVPHLVVQSARGPVVVLVMTQEKVLARRAFSDRGYHGVLVPTTKGSLAVLNSDGQNLDEIVSAVESRIRYLN